MTPEEAQQAETVARIREIQEQRNLWHHEKILPVRQVTELLEIVDSQSQKIEAMQKPLNAYSLLTQAAGSLMQKQYTEEELREMYYRDCGDAALNMDPFEWFARFLGVIKEKEGRIFERICGRADDSCW